VPISFEPKKNERNIATRGISFEHAEEFEWDGALVVEDTRKDYGSADSRRWPRSQGGYMPWSLRRAPARSM